MVTPLFRKLNLRDQAVVIAANVPESFEAELALLSGVTVVRDATKVKSADFAIGFAITKAELDRISKSFVAKLMGDAILWIAYPKGTSKKYKCEFNRDSGWDVLRGAGFDTVRMVAIDEDWSALRFRRVEFIKA